MNFLITDINAKQDSNFNNIMNFETVEQRDEYINSLFTSITDYKTEIKGKVETKDIKESGMGTITISHMCDYTQLKAKNYIILKDCGNDEVGFYFIKELRKAQKDGEYILTIQLDYFTTYLGIVDSMRYLSLIEGHVPVINYVNYTYKEVAKNPIDRNIILGDLKPTGLNGVSSDSLNYNNTWVIVFRKLQNNEEGAKLQTQVRNNNNKFGRVISTLPFKIFGAPIIDRGFENIKSDYTAYVEKLLKKYQENGDGLTYAIKIVPFEFDNPGVTMAQYSQNDSPQFVEIKEIKGFAGLPFENSSVEYYEQNQYTLKIPDTIKSVLELLEGVNEYSLSLDGVKDFKIPLKYLFKNDDGEFITKFQCLTTFAPGSSKEGIVFDDGINDFTGDEKKLLPLFEDEYTWTNDTELAIYVNQLNEYQANNKNAWLDWAKPTSELTKTGSFTSPLAFGRSLINAIEGEVNVAVQRNSMKRAPMQASGDSATYFQLNSSVSIYSFMITKFKFVGNERNAILDMIYRKGLQLDNEFLIESYSDIKRKRFNYIRSLNASEAIDYNSELPESILDPVAKVFDSGVFIWQDIDNFKVYDKAWADNGEGLEDFIKTKKELM